MNPHHPLVLILNLTVIIVLSLLILPTLLSSKEKPVVRISFSIIFLVVIVNCIENLFIFYLGNYHWLGFQLMSQFVTLLFGPAVYFYVKSVAGGETKNFLPHFIVPAISLVLGLVYLFLPSFIKNQLIFQVRTGSSVLYNLMYSLLLIVPFYYFIIAKRWLHFQKLNRKDPLYELHQHKHDWAKEFLNYMIYSSLAFVIFYFIITYFFHLPTLYIDLIGLPLYFLAIYSVLSVRSVMMSKELETKFRLHSAMQERKLNEQRVSISRDLHDNIGAYVNSLISKIDYLQNESPVSTDQISDLKENAKTIISLVRQTIWVLNNDDIEAEAAFDIVKNYILKTFRNTGINVKFHESITENHKLTSEEATHIFRMIQETCQNVLKHAKASTVLINLISEDRFTIAIQDNGKGFISNETKEGYGLKNIKSRASRIGVEIQFSSIPSQGTKVSIIKNKTQ